MHVAKWAMGQAACSLRPTLAAPCPSLVAAQPAIYCFGDKCAGIDARWSRCAKEATGPLVPRGHVAHVCEQIMSSPILFSTGALSACKRQPDANGLAVCLTPRRLEAEGSISPKVEAAIRKAE